MTGFYADPNGMNALYNQVRGISNDGTTAEEYVVKYADITLGEEGLIFDLVGPHNHAYHVVHSAMTTLAGLSQKIATRINQSQVRYQNTDQETAARMDAELPGAVDKSGLQQGLADVPTGRAPFTDAADPTWHLRHPDWIDEGVAFEFDPAGDLLSPSAYIRWAVSSATGTDPFEWMLTWISGDWQAYKRCATVWSHVGEACPDFGANLTKAASDTSQVWRGQAAEGCQETLMALGQAVTQFKGSCDQLHKSYLEAAQAAKDLYEALTGVAGELVDSAILWALSVAAGTATIETVIGAVAGYAAAAFYAKKIYDLIDEATTLYGRAKATVAAIKGVIETVNANELSELKVGD
jgi:uncharacterized protein YukE